MKEQSIVQDFWGYIARRARSIKSAIGLRDSPSTPLRTEKVLFHQKSADDLIAKINQGIDASSISNEAKAEAHKAVLAYKGDLVDFIDHLYYQAPELDPEAQLTRAAMGIITPALNQNQVAVAKGQAVAKEIYTAVGGTLVKLKVF